MVIASAAEIPPVKKAWTSKSNRTRRPGWQSRASRHNGTARSWTSEQGSLVVAWQYCSTHASRSAVVSMRVLGSRGAVQTLTAASARGDMKVSCAVVDEALASFSQLQSRVAGETVQPGG